MKKKKPDNRKRLLSLIAVICAVAFFSSYIIYHIVNKANNELKTEVAYKETVYSTIDTKCFVIRDEEFITNTVEGTTVSFAKNGERVARGDTVSIVFDSAESASSYIKIKEIKKDIAHYKELSGQANLQTLNVDSLTKKINNELNIFLDSVDKRDFSQATLDAENFRNSVTGKQIATGSNLDFSEKLQSLNDELELLESRNYVYTEVKSDSAGYFVSGSDGYENLIDTSKLDTLTVDELEKAIKSKPQSISDSVVGRTVDSFKWYIACVVESDKTIDLSFDRTIYINFPVAGIEKLPVKLYRIGDRTDKETVVIFSCDEMNENLAGFRIEDIEIITDEYTGFKVPNSAIRTVDGEKGVYIIRGNLMGFRKVHILYSTDKFSLVDNPENSSDFIRLYDNVVTEGVELYDNKLI